MADSILAGLNESQRAAVSCVADTVAILAGPGSGKTHTLTSRTAWLLQHQGYQPYNVIVATFTNKSAKEMGERIGKLIGEETAKKLILGTFHSIAVRYLRRYGHLIGLAKDFAIADSGDVKSIVMRITKRHRMVLDPRAAAARISSRKAKGHRWNATQSAKSIDAQEFEVCFEEYEEHLERSNMLDFDDLLLRCVTLLRDYPDCVANVQAVLIDEFQDTNLVQFDLMRLFAAHQKRVTIVGDPDQSIYGWRSAETENFKRMTRRYPDTVTIPLEENYRSSGAILLTALEVIRQDQARLEKNLLPTHSVGTQPVLRKLANAHMEAQWIVVEMRRCLALTGDLMNFNDVAILMRSASLSRVIESALGKAGISYRMVGGARFYDRVEVKLILDYLRVVDQPDNNDAFARVCNVPSRRVGNSTIKLLLEEAEQSRTTLWRLANDIVQGNITAKTKLAKQTEQGLSTFINIILTARKKVSDDNISPVELIQFIIRRVNLEEFLERNYPESEDRATRMANVQELIALAADSSLEMADETDIEALPEIDGLQQERLSRPLSHFLANVALASSSDSAKTDEQTVPQPQVTISTIHAAKGLEWPVVFIPATYQGSIPHSRAEDEDEERRLLYVAMTRAKALLYLSYPLKNSDKQPTTISPFLTSKHLRPYMSSRGPRLSSDVVQSVAEILRRRPPTAFDGTAIEALVSLEDDGYEIEDDEDQSVEKDYSKWDGHHFNTGQHPPKKRRLDSEADAAVRRPSNTYTPSYTTTVEAASTFTTAAISKPSFVSVKSCYHALNEQSANVARIAQSTRSTAKAMTHGVENRAADIKKITTRTSKLPVGQRSLFSFMGQSERTRDANPLAAPADPRVQKSREQPKASQGSIGGSQASLPTPVMYNNGIPADLAHHKIRTGPWRKVERSKRHEAEPQIPDCFQSGIAENVEDTMPQIETTVVDTAIRSPGRLTKKKPGVNVAWRPVNTLNEPAPTIKKQLGVRRALTGWADRKHK